MCMCPKCAKISGVLVLLLGVALLLKDLAIWNFWGVSWYTGLILLFGIGGLASSACKECQAVKKGK